MSSNGYDRLFEPPLDYDRSASGSRRWGTRHRPSFLGVLKLLDFRTGGSMVRLSGWLYCTDTPGGRSLDSNSSAALTIRWNAA